MSDDPTAIRSVAVSPADVVDAYVYTRRNPETAVLRVTPPFHGRMRARLHVYHLDDAAETGAIHIAPGGLLEDAVRERYPRLELDADASDAPERLRSRRETALDRWREVARESLVDAVVVETSTGSHRIAITPLG